MLSRRQGEFGWHHEEPDRGGARRGACPDHSGLPGRQGDPASGAGVGRLHPHRYQVAKTLRTVGSERTAGLAAAGQAGYVRRRLSQPGTGPAGGTAASRHVALGWAGSGGETQLQRLRRVAYPAPPAPLLVARGRDLKPGLKMPLLLVGTLNIDEDLPDL